MRLSVSEIFGDILIVLNPGCANQITFWVSYFPEVVLLEIKGNHLGWK